MTTLRRPGKINDHTTMIDLGMYGVQGITALYLGEGRKRCLIDGGTGTEAGRLIKTSKSVGALSPDGVVVTHPHYDHAHGIPAMRRGAAQQLKQIEQPRALCPRSSIRSFASGDDRSENTNDPS